MKGYWRNESATNEIFVDGPDGRWMRTGDIAYVNQHGWFYIVDRMKELIKVKGNQVAPAELEALLLEHPQVADAAVVGVTIKGEEVPRAYIVLQEGEKGQEKEIQNWLAKRVTRHKRLVGGVAFVDAIPKNPVCSSLSFLVWMLTKNSRGRFCAKYCERKRRLKLAIKIPCGRSFRF
jgi:4-coumarate--CoA ligase